MKRLNWKRVRVLSKHFQSVEKWMSGVTTLDLAQVATQAKT